ncbi:acetyl-CoA carboxylase biotin carboxyl carrier protein [Liquorilactobacillus vini]|uniref:Biotin carboxyl carrier protein of acetyl-CoA carboxylase n=1 Tax=Liquorilactobacillus vini DSM 20605 TaxID=1133569 RepID=A0A0R2CC02_9LACO|nr:acetyl-CoA carboxylase biotin carboxyl carrier protein [Liquorilactobacillus vini]KRM88890.1 biotin carboxyl carrier protein of acetyl-CoA carboxylase [Liquorilactobacillus vini DSM 20605]
MNLKEIQRLISDFNQSPCRELEIKTKDFQLHLSKNELSTKLLKQLQLSASPAGSAMADKLPAKKTPAADKPARAFVKAPLVGSVYLQPAPTKPAYVKVGQLVHPGDVVCVIEAMKVMTEIKSDREGKIKQVLVKNEELVEYGQPLFEIEEL